MRNHESYHVPDKWRKTPIEERYNTLCQKWKFKGTLEIDPHYDMYGEHPFGILKAISESIKKNDNAAIELAIDFIVTPILFSSSGFIKQSMARRLKTTPLEESDKEKLRIGLLDILYHRDYGHEYIAYINLLQRIGLGKREDLYVQKLSDNPFIFKDMQEKLAV